MIAPLTVIAPWPLTWWMSEYDVRAVDDRHAVAAEHLHHVAGEEGGGVLVDADAEQSRAARHQGQEAADAVALAEVLVDDDARNETEPGRHLRHAHARRGAAGAEGDHVRGEDRGAGAGAGDDDAVPCCRCLTLRANGVPADDAGQAHLVAAGEEDAGDVVQDLERSRATLAAARSGR